MSCGGSTFDYVRHHVDVATRQLADPRGKRVLVVGCNRGREVSLFLEAGAREVWGIDVMDEIGAEYPDPAAHYVHMSAESMTFDEGMFDIVFCLATMEHIASLEAAYAQVARVTATEGLLYAVSAPLWNSRQGHHKDGMFDVDRYPWIHLRFGSDELKRMCASGEIQYHGTADVEPHIDYMMSRAHMNHRPARDYLRVCSELDRVALQRNDVELEPATVLELLRPSERGQLETAGADELELRALTHTLIGWKDRRPDGGSRASEIRGWRGRIRRSRSGSRRDESERVSTLEP